MVYTHQAFVQQYPVATKRVLRAILKAADLCTSGPERVARFLVAKGYTTNYDYARETMQEVGMLKSTPQKLIAQGTDWRFFNELKRELKG
jgi:NitT/TauT family transport system substrate-binding protein